MASVYGEEAGQQLPDERWLRDVGAKGWIVLMKDDAIRRRPAELNALIDAGVRAFCLTNAQLRAAEQTERFVSNRHRIIQQARKPGPYICGVYERGIKKMADGLISAQSCSARPWWTAAGIISPIPEWRCELSWVRRRPVFVGS